MTRLLSRSFLAATLLVSLATAASAAVTLRAAVTPTTIPQCSTGQLFVALGNTGTAPIGVRVCVAITRNDTVLVGPACGRTFLAAGETRSHEFMFFVPGFVPPGNYAFDFKAQGSDGSSAEAKAAFAVVAHAPGATCFPIAGVSNVGDVSSLSQSMGLTPDATTGTRPQTWGSLKVIYR